MLQGEAGDERNPKRSRGRPLKIVHFHDKISPTHFAKAILGVGLDPLPIHDWFHPYIGTIPKTIILKTNTRCN
jgi:hypothetical protein